MASRFRRLLALPVLLCGTCQSSTEREFGVDLLFQGRVTNELGQGVVAVLRLQQRFLECDSDNALAEMTTTASTDGSYELLYSAIEGLDGCFVLKAEVTNPSAEDSLMLRREDLLRRGDPYGSGWIAADMVVAP